MWSHNDLLQNSLFLISPEKRTIIVQEWETNHGLESTTLFYPGFNHISPLDPSLSASTTSNLLLFSFYMVSLKVLSLVFFFSFFTQLYTTPLSHIISPSSINHKLYADDTQLFLSFSTCNFPQNIQLLQNIISEISSWMASNFLSLNSSKIEFILIGLPTQLANVDNPSLSMPSNTSIKPVASAGNLGVIFDSNLSFSDHISYISKTCFAHSWSQTYLQYFWWHYRLHYCNFTYSFQNWLLQFTVSESQLPANQPTTTYSQLCCSYCH